MERGQIRLGFEVNHLYRQKERLSMRIFELKNRAIESKTGECLLGFQETGSHACYMTYGVLRPREKARSMKPGLGHEEIVLAMKGDLEVTGSYSGVLKEGCALHLQGSQECFLKNQSEFEAVYIISGGHSSVGCH